MMSAMGYLDSVYTANFTTQDGLKHVAKALQTAMKRDSATGDGMKIAVINRKGFKEYTGDDLDKLLLK